MRLAGRPVRRPAARERTEPRRDGRRGQIIVEPHQINPNKAAHIGQCAIAILGAKPTAMLRASGRGLEAQNKAIDNTGVRSPTVSSVSTSGEAESGRGWLAAAERFDYLCWDLYADIFALPGAPRGASSGGQDALHAIEAGQAELAELAHLVCRTPSSECHLRPCSGLDIELRVVVPSARSEILPPEVLGRRVRASQGAQGHLFRDPGGRTQAAGSARVGLFFVGGRGRRQGDRSLQRHR